MLPRGVPPAGVRPYLPPAGIPRRGNCRYGYNTLACWAVLANVPANSVARFGLFGPNGEFYDDSGYGLLTPQFQRYMWVPHRFGGGYLNQMGTWSIRMEINGELVAYAPFNVVYAGAGNRAPYPVTAAFYPPTPRAGQVIQCRLQPGAELRDPDYDVVRYRYTWRVNNRVIRNLVSAGRADVIPVGSVQVGDALTCQITPSDGRKNGPGIKLAATIAN